MRRMILAAAAAAALALPIASVLPAAHAETIYPWCAYYGGGKMGARNCGFVSYAQCMQTVSGIGGFCDRNPYNYYGPAKVIHTPGYR